jgi:hypothetical protein
MLLPGQLTDTIFDDAGFKINRTQRHCTGGNTILHGMKANRFCLGSLRKLESANENFPDGEFENEAGRNCRSF